jgi:hypothetical protein
MYVESGPNIKHVKERKHYSLHPGLQTIFFYIHIWELIPTAAHMLAVKKASSPHADTHSHRLLSHVGISSRLDPWGVREAVHLQLQPTGVSLRR